MEKLKLPKWLYSMFDVVLSFFERRRIAKIKGDCYKCKHLDSDAVCQSPKMTPKTKTHWGRCVDGVLWEERFR